MGVSTPRLQESIRCALFSEDEAANFTSAPHP